MSASLLDQDLSVAMNKDSRSHNDLKTKFKNARSAPRKGQCSLHWSLCPNMCQVDYELTYKFEEIRGNKMKKYKQFSDELVEKRDEIVEDLKVNYFARKSNPKFHFRAKQTKFTSGNRI